MTDRQHRFSVVNLIAKKYIYSFSHLSFMIIIFASFLLLDCCHVFKDDQSKGENENDEKNNFLDLFSHLSFIIIIISSFLLLDCCHVVKDDQSKHEAEDEDDDKKTKWRKRFHTFLMRTIIIYHLIWEES